MLSSTGRLAGLSTILIGSPLQLLLGRLDIDGSGSGYFQLDGLTGSASDRLAPTGVDRRRHGQGPDMTHVGLRIHGDNSAAVDGKRQCSTMGKHGDLPDTG